MKVWKIIGLMSGTSMDGLDIASCHFWEENGKWRFRIEKCHTYPYPKDLESRLLSVREAKALDFAFTDALLGKWMGEQVLGFLDGKVDEIDFISSHGHTVFHQPHLGFSAQIGSADQIAATTGLKVISNFRSLDVALGGQGAPLVPFGDQMLFADYEYCLNLGGIANISTSLNHNIIAFDICPCNLALNREAQKLGMAYDKGGQIAGKGIYNPELLNQLNALDYYQKPSPKSLGIEWVEASFFPILDQSAISTEDKLASISHHIARQIAFDLKQIRKLKNISIKEKLLVTGGGAFHQFLIEKLKENLGESIQLVIPDTETIQFKEALVFAFLGLMRWFNQTNVVCDYTGASKSSSSGSIHGFH
jgi:anhydro-N-acetylmuramic acid kinase